MTIQIIALPCSEFSVPPMRDDLSEELASLADLMICCFQNLDLTVALVAQSMACS